MDDKDVTFDVPRFMSFIDLAHLSEAIKVTDQYFQDKINGTEDRNEIGNLNATRQSVHRSAFLSSCAIIDQHLDANCIKDAERCGIQLRPKDLRTGGIYRSIDYANKVLGYAIDRSMPPWKELGDMQDLRNHLIHFGPGFDNSPEHAKRIEKYKKLSFVSLRPTICFSYSQLMEVQSLLMDCVESFLGQKRDNLTSEDNSENAATVSDLRVAHKIVR